MANKAIFAAATVVAVTLSLPSAVAGKGRHGLTPAESRGLAFAEHRCAACHAVVKNRTSPNPEAPSFQDIANRTAVSRQTLRQFLRDSHNYPAVMNFRIEDGEIEDLSEYVVTLQRPDYGP